VRRLLWILVLSLLGAGVYHNQIHIDELRKDLPPGYEILYLPTGKHLRLLTFGYSSFLSDIFYLWSIQHTTTIANPDHVRDVEKIYQVINELDPLYVDPYQIGAMTMVYEMGDLPLAFRLLDRGIKSIPDNWYLPMDAGFYAYLHAKDYALAIRYFDEALRRPGAPPVLRRLKADMYRRKGDLETARDFWGEIYRTATDEHSRRVAYNHYFDLTQETDIAEVRRAVEAYRGSRGHWPARLLRLVDEGFLAALPKNLNGEDYRYDARTGEVSPASPFKLDRRAPS